jgi:short-subunit dehydrogenase
LYKTNITVSIVYPGRIDTNISKNAFTVMVSNLARRMRTTVGMKVDVCAKK